MCVWLSCRILVMEQLSGVPLTDLDSIRSITSKDPETVLIAALNTWFASVLGADTFHADVHAGNRRNMQDSQDDGTCSWATHQPDAECVP